jgi:hypothetical protein
MKTTPRSWSERVLRFLIRYVGTVSLLALVPVFMPYAWMEGIHQALGMGTLPAQPIVGYLARSLSLFYALMGGLLWICSFDLHRSRVVLCYLGAAFIFFGMLIWGVDIVEGMPSYWRNVEGPVVIGFGIAILIPALRLESVVTTAGESMDKR